MGIFDEYRDGNSTITLAGDRRAAAQFIPQARKFAEVMRGKLDLGANLGMDYKDALTLDDFTTMSVRLSPGVTNPTMHIEITSTPPVPEPGKPVEEIKITPDCPRLPLGRPGARMFTQLFGHDVLGAFGLPLDTFTQTRAKKVNTPYISPSLDQGAYCSTGPFPGNGDLLFHNEVRLARPFRLLGRDVQTCFLHSRWLGFAAPNVFLSFSSTPIPLNMPCDCNFQGSPTFTPNPESLGPGNNFALLMQKNFGSLCYPATSFEEDGVVTNFLVEGEVRIFHEIPGQDIEVMQDQGMESKAVQDEEGELRSFAAINWTDGNSEAEIVFLYASTKCPAAVGFFYGGLDGHANRNFDYQGFVTGLMCKFEIQCIKGETPTVPAAFAPYFVGANRQAIAYADCQVTSSITGTDRAEDNIAGRTFWFEIDGEGNPSGLGIHNGPALAPGIRSTDLVFN